MIDRRATITPYLNKEFRGDITPLVLFAVVSGSLHAHVSLTPQQARLAAEDLMKAATESERMANG